MAGRKPLSIPDQVERLPGSPLAKERLRVILANLAGELTPSEACAALGIEESWYFELRHRALGRWVETLEPDSPGRRPGTPPVPEDERIAYLEEQVERLELEPKASRLREGLAIISSPRPANAAKKAHG
jgi:hypothetical protein